MLTHTYIQKGRLISHGWAAVTNRFKCRVLHVIEENCSLVGSGEKQVSTVDLGPKMWTALPSLIPEVLGAATFHLSWVIFGCGIVERKLSGDDWAPPGALSLS